MRSAIEQDLVGGDEIAGAVEGGGRQAPEARRAPEIELDRERWPALGEQRLAVEREIDPRRNDAAHVGLHPDTADGQLGRWARAAAGSARSRYRDRGCGDGSRGRGRPVASRQSRWLPEAMRAAAVGAARRAGARAIRVAGPRAPARAGRRVRSPGPAGEAPGCSFPDGESAGRRRAASSRHAGARRRARSDSESDRRARRHAGPRRRAAAREPADSPLASAGAEAARSPRRDPASTMTLASTMVRLWLRPGKWISTSAARGSASAGRSVE